MFEGRRLVNVYESAPDGARLVVSLCGSAGYLKARVENPEVLDLILKCGSCPHSLLVRRAPLFLLENSRALESAE